MILFLGTLSLGDLDLESMVLDISIFMIIKMILDMSRLFDWNICQAFCG